ncbi:LuxR family transcriptional regulator [Kibdelosporangium aridum]|uniref:LuxR family transcriptional regulator n=1 Tax=Kibdelosporangium aridum TaxID=2030 RepID=A0A428YR92_KIBAR|nr:LuxR C-terminal-related transcriptional regulator [Kibdelosporangium aridum]RSM71606.1 LuxR family transcriptional regulator [Kibdelosporangium aridum]
MVIRGAPGSGRTALLTAAEHALREHGHPVTHITAAELTRMRPQQVALLIDDADTVPIQDLLACRRNGCLVIAACRDTSTSELSGAADHTLDLEPLRDDDVLALLHDVGPLDQPVIDALRTALGPLFGNPGTVLATVEHLQHRLVTVADTLCLRDLHIALPPNHPLCAHADPLLTAVAILGELRIGDLPLLAGALGEPVAACGQRIDALVESDVLTVDTAGKLRCICPALATALAEDAGPHQAQRLHHAVATQLMRRNGDPATIADHLTASGLSTPTARLLRLADRARTQQPHRAAHWYAAALRDLPRERHEHANVLRSVLKLLVQNGQYDLLAGVLADEATMPTADPAVRDDLEAAAMLTAFHTGHPVKVAHEPRAGGPLDLYAWWTGERRTWAPDMTPTPDDALLTSAELRLIHCTLSLDHAGCDREVGAVRNPGARQRLEDLMEAGATGDPTAVFEIVLGAGYRAPADGPLALGRTVIRSYAAARWSDALPAARRLELTGTPDSPIHQMSRIHAAAIHLTRGEYAAASNWLATVSHDPRFAAARAAVECSLLHRAGDSLGAVHLAWRTYRRARRAGTLVGVERLLLTALQIAIRGADREMAAALHEEIEQLYIRSPWRCARQVMLLSRGLVNHDAVAAAEGANLSRIRGHRPDLLWACRILAQFCDQPGPLIAELNTFAADPSGGFLLPTQLTAMMRRVGVPEPPPEGFTSTELRIIELIRTGHTTRQIAALLQLSATTVDNHLARLYDRTGYRTRAELAAASVDGRLTGGVA